LISGEGEMAQRPQDVRQRFDGTPEQAAGRLVREPPNGWRPIEIVDHDPAWAERYAAVSAAIRAALAELVLGLEHIGSTSVPGLAAKSIVDVDLVAEENSTMAKSPVIDEILARIFAAQDR
jgi:GrpB-like predicted nucleotidyltransferase (UPF0157 family)